MRLIRNVLSAVLLAAVSQSALAWPQEGHTVSGAIAYEELRPWRAVRSRRLH
jgi:hypothetical protein